MYLNVAIVTDVGPLPENRAKRINTAYNIDRDA